MGEPMRCFFVSDLHGKTSRYRKLFDRIIALKPEAVFIGGDLLQSALTKKEIESASSDNFISGYLRTNLEKTKDKLGTDYPPIFVIPGNDDGRLIETALLELENQRLIKYMHGRKAELTDFTVYGYACVPPTPFQLKDWERYDVSRFVDPGCIPLEEGRFTVPPNHNDLLYGTIEKDLQKLVGDQSLEKTILLFHSPPYKSCLDRADLDNRMIDHVPLDVHVGSIAIRRFIERRRPMLTLHGHIHESVRLTGCWHDTIDGTYIIGAAHDGPELALVIFDPNNPAAAVRQLL